MNKGIYFVLCISISLFPYFSVVAETEGKISGSAAGIPFNLKGECAANSDQHFSFKTDGISSQDSDGDGYFAQVMRLGPVWTLRLIKDGEIIYNGSPGEFKKEGESYVLSREVERRKEQDKIIIDLTVSCVG